MNDTQLNPITRALIITLLSLGFITLLAGAVLYLLRRIRKRSLRGNLQVLPFHAAQRTSIGKGHGLRITTTSHSDWSSAYAGEKGGSSPSSATTLDSPVPEIRITFPEEIDESGRRQNGRVLVVRVGEHNVGLEPLDEDLPPYQQSDLDRFQSIEIDRKHNR